MNGTGHARAILRIRATLLASWAFAVALVAAIWWTAWHSTSSLVAYLGIAACAGIFAYPIARVHRVKPAASPAIQLADADAPELVMLIRQLSLQLQVPAPDGVELSPDCDAWLEPRGRTTTLVIGTPFLWWLRVSELRGLLAPVLAGALAAEDPRVRSARDFVRRLDLAASRLRRPWRLVTRLVHACDRRGEAMERSIASQASERAQPVEPATRVLAHEQVALAAAGWDRVLTRLAMPAWTSGYAPIRLNAALVSALTELGRRDRLTVGLAARLSERPACDLLETPGNLDSEISKLACTVFSDYEIGHTVGWERYVEQVVEPTRRTAAASVAPGPSAGLVRDAIASWVTAKAPTPGSEPTAGDDATLIGSYLECVLVDSGLARWDLDWLDGVVLRDCRGATVPVAEFAAPIVERANPGALQSWLSGQREVS